MAKEKDRVVPIKRRISWIVPETSDDEIKLVSVDKISSFTYKELERLRNYIDYILEVQSKDEQKDAILTIIYICTFYDAKIIKSHIADLIRLTETLMYTKIEDYPDYDTVLNILSMGSVVKNENRRI